jgi:hypothetical protein
VAESTAPHTGELGLDGEANLTRNGTKLNAVFRLDGIGVLLLDALKVCRPIFGGKTTDHGDLDLPLDQLGQECFLRDFHWCPFRHLPCLERNRREAFSSSPSELFEEATA